MWPTVSARSSCSDGKPAGGRFPAWIVNCGRASVGAPDVSHRRGCEETAAQQVCSQARGPTPLPPARHAGWHFGGRERNFTGEVFWARGYFVSTVGLDEAMVRAYIRNQEHEDERYDQMKLVGSRLHGLPAPLRRPTDRSPALSGVI